MNNGSANPGKAVARQLTDEEKEVFAKVLQNADGNQVEIGIDRVSALIEKRRDSALALSPELGHWWDADNSGISRP